MFRRRASQKSQQASSSSGKKESKAQNTEEPISEEKQQQNQPGPDTDTTTATTRDTPKTKMAMSGTLFESAKKEIEDSLKPAFDENPQYRAAFDVMVVPDKIHIWKAVWYDSAGKLNINWCYRVHQSGALGPYKGGLRFSPEVDLDTLRFLALEQVLKNALTGRAMGGGKGGSDFNPRGRSDEDLKRFCEAFMAGLRDHIGPDVDVPAGDQGVGEKAIGYLFGAWRRQGGGHVGVLTGKGTDWGGSEVRTEATGYGLLYITQELLKDHKDSMKGKHVVVSGSGNVATYAAKKAIELGAIVHTLSDRNGTYWADKGMSAGDVDAILEFKTGKGKLPTGVEQLKDVAPWEAKTKEQTIDIAFPCATQNEIDEQAAKMLVEQRKVKAVCEGANMPSTNPAIEVYKKAKIHFLSAKLSNLGGVGTSFMEMMQNASKEQWDPTRIDQELQTMMKDAYKKAKDAATRYNVQLYEGANLAGFVRVADAMIAQGYV